MSETTDLVDPTESTNDQLAAEAAETTKVEKPPGSPDLWPFQQLPRRQRAAFMQAFAQVQISQRKLPTDLADDDKKEVDIADAGTLFEMFADLEDALRVAAQDQETFADWAATCSDEHLNQLCTWYMDRFQVGEAPASPA